MSERQRAKFSLLSIVRAVLADTTSPDLAALTDEVLQRIRKVDQRAALEEALPGVIRSQMVLDAPPYDPPGSTTEAEQDIAQLRLSTEQRSEREFDGTWGRVAKMRDWLEALHNTSMLGVDERKFFRNFTADDCFAAAERRYASAARTRARADQLTRTGELIKLYDVQELHELPDAVQRAELSKLREAS